jgi:hypothetical protein
MSYRQSIKLYAQVIKRSLHNSSTRFIKLSTRLITYLKKNVCKTYLMIRSSRGSIELDRVGQSTIVKLVRMLELRLVAFKINLRI